MATSAAGNEPFIGTTKYTAFSRRARVPLVSAAAPEAYYVSLACHLRVTFVSLRVTSYHLRVILKRGRLLKNAVHVPCDLRVTYRSFSPQDTGVPKERHTSGGDTYCPA